MNLEPISRYATPKLPTRDVLDARPELLRLLPKRWQGNAVVVAALAACLAMSRSSQCVAADGPSRVAPMFVHGQGTGSFGCMSVSPPVFLSEDEARQVITEEAKRGGISFAEGGKTLPSIEMPATKTESVTRADGSKSISWKRGLKAQPVELDGFDRKHNVAFEYLSKNEAREWLPGEDYLSTAWSCDMISTSKALAAAIEKGKPAGAYGVFYDPLVSWDEARKKAGIAVSGRQKDWQAQNAAAKAAAREIALEQLRAQVKDFIRWLKAQGVI